MEKLVTELAELLMSRGFLLSTAESCTGGMVAAELTAIAGSSNWFDSGFVTYSNQAKQVMLGVSLATLESKGAVSAEVVAEMAAGAVQRSQAQIAVSISGVAGPGGGSAEKPVGTVWMGWALPNGKIETEQFRFAGDRASVREQATRQVLLSLLDRLKK